jgi:hypothetical protein
MNAMQEKRLFQQTDKNMLAKHKKDIQSPFQEKRYQIKRNSNVRRNQR